MTSAATNLWRFFRGANASVAAAFVVSAGMTAAVAVPMAIDANDTSERDFAAFAEPIQLDDPRFPEPIELGESELALPEPTPTPIDEPAVTPTPGSASTPQPTAEVLTVDDDWFVALPDPRPTDGPATPTSSPASPTTAPSTPTPTGTTPQPTSAPDPQPTTGPVPTPTTTTVATPRPTATPQPAPAGSADVYVLYIGNDPLVAGSTSTITLKAASRGDDTAYNVTMSVSVTGGRMQSMQAGAAGWSCSPTSATRWVCQASQMADGELVYTTLDVIPDAGGTMVVNTSINASTPDPAPGSNNPAYSFGVSAPPPPPPTPTPTPVPTATPTPTATPVPTATPDLSIGD